MKDFIIMSLVIPVGGWVNLSEGEGGTEIPIRKSEMAHKKPRRCTCYGAGACYESNGLLIERLQLNTFNGKPNTPSFCFIKKHDLKRFKVL